MRALILVAGAALAVSACSSNDDANNTMVVEDNMSADMNTMDMNATDPSMTLNAADGMNATENAVVNDLTNNTADANLANGM